MCRLFSLEGTSIHKGFGKCHRYATIWERDIKLDSPAPFICPGSWFWFDCSACLATPGNKVNLLDYLHPVCLSRFMAVSKDYSFGQGPIFSCFALRLGQKIHFFEPCSLLKCIQVQSMCLFFIYLSSSAIFLNISSSLTAVLYVPFKCSTEDLCSPDSLPLKHSNM